MKFTIHSVVFFWLRSTSHLVQHCTYVLDVVFFFRNLVSQHYCFYSRKPWVFLFLASALPFVIVSIV